MVERARMKKIMVHSQLSDGINALPDELLVCILSFLSHKEAAATSIICRRWRHLWLWTLTNKLDFDGLEFFQRIWLRTKRYKYMDIYFLKKAWSISKNIKESWKYIAWVNNILRLHKGCNIDEFRIDFFLAKIHKRHIDRWLQYASDKKVQRLELNLRWNLFHSFEAYTLRSISFRHLRTMRMQWVNISDEGFELLLDTCFMLEELSISYSQTLTTLKIIGPSLALKRLEINHCNHLTLVEIHDVNLVFFMYYGVRLQQFALKNVPHLVEMHLGDEILENMKDFLLMFSSYLPQLKKLTMDSVCMDFFKKKAAKMFYNNIEMSNLEQLILKFSHAWSLKPITYFFRASPVLQSFILESYGKVRESGRRYERVGAYQYPHLKRVEFIGYRGTSDELDLAVHLLKNGSALEEFIIDLRKRDNPQMSFNYFWPNSVHGLLPVGYDSTHEEEGINVVKARVKNQLIRHLLPSTLPHLHLKIL